MVFNAPSVWVQEVANHKNVVMQVLQLARLVHDAVCISLPHFPAVIKGGLHRNDLQACLLPVAQATKGNG